MGTERGGAVDTAFCSKHSRVCHDRISVNPLFIGVFVASVCTFENSHLAVFSQFRYQALPLQFYMETYRSGHNGADSKSSSPNGSQSSKKPLTVRFSGICLSPHHTEF